jgi:dihydrodipicolinate reductase
LLKEMKDKAKLAHERRVKREVNEIDVLGERVGQVAGQHEVWFTPRESYSERLILQHDILTPEILGVGALSGVRWISEAQREKKPAKLYNFYEDVLGLGKM